MLFLLHEIVAPEFGSNSGMPENGSVVDAGFVDGCAMVSWALTRSRSGELEGVNALLQIGTLE